MCAEKKRTDWGRVGFVPFWWEDLALYKEHGGRGFGVDPDTFHWSEWARVARRAQSLAGDQNAFAELEKDMVQHPEVAPEVRNARMQALEKRRAAS